MKNLTTEDTENTERENDLQCELAAWELLREATHKYDNLATEHMLKMNKLAEERDEALMDRANGDMATMTINHYERLIKELAEARAVADELASIASHCLGWHDHESAKPAIKIAAALNRWKKMKEGAK